MKNITKEQALELAKIALPSAYKEDISIHIIEDDPFILCDIFGVDSRGELNITIWDNFNISSNGNFTDFDVIAFGKKLEEIKNG